MDVLEEAVNAKDFVLRSLRPDDWEKFVLPGVMVFLLLTGAFSTLSLQESYGEKALNNSLEGYSDLQVLNVRSEVFPDSLERPSDEVKDEIQSGMLEEQRSLRSTPLFPVKGWLSRLAFDSGVFPMLPEKELAPWGPEKEYVRAVTLLRYRTAKIQELGDEAAGNSDYSYRDFQRDVEDIRSRSWNSSEVQSLLENSSQKGSVNLGFLGGTTLENVKADGVDSISFVSFLPSLFVSFLIYYLIGAVSVQGNKELVERMKDKDDSIQDFDN